MDSDGKVLEFFQKSVYKTLFIVFLLFPTLHVGENLFTKHVGKKLTNICEVLLSDNTHHLCDEARLI